MAGLSTDASCIVSLNAGSSTLKFAVFAAPVQGAKQHVESRVGPALVRQTVAVAQGDHAAAFKHCFTQLAEKQHKPMLLSHRIVHGGASYSEPTLVTSALVEALRQLVPLAPLHLPAGISGIEEVLEYYPNVPQIACFDTAFHHTLPAVAQRLPLPPALHAAGLRKYGFHGLSYEYVLHALQDQLPERVIIAHLGSGSSLAAVLGGHCIDTSMGFTPCGGILMATRTGDLDPGILLYLQREKAYSLAEIERLVEREGGLFALGGSKDVKELVQRRAADPNAELALHCFAYAIKKTLGAFIAALGGIDLLVFTGGIGENSAEIRAMACDGLLALGLELDHVRNQSGVGELQSSRSRAQIRVIATDEEHMLAAHALRVSMALSEHMPG